MQLYPDWSSRANATRGKKRKRKQDPADGGSSANNSQITLTWINIVTCETCITYYIYFLYLHVWGNSVGRPGPILLRVEQTPCWLDESYARLSAACMIIHTFPSVVSIFIIIIIDHYKDHSSLRPSTACSIILTPSKTLFLSRYTSQPTP